ncbi:hypothetical protein J2W98_002656 [Paenibacillus peoriae]|uniref:Uncharacterized protein n=1 Tax=Paenibacillus peoriae TaxID=59893 RepID=A0ABU1QFF8_9BACL|nr:hypothetical protein [Paenibacillus peoriae]
MPNHQAVFGVRMSHSHKQAARPWRKLNYNQ